MRSEGATSTRRGNPLLIALLAFVVFRVSMEVVGLLAAFRSHALSGVAADPLSTFLIWRHWDVGWFVNIANNGYVATSHVLGDKGTYMDGAAFPPAMPALMALGRLVGLPPAVSGVLFGGIFLFAALALLYQLVRLDFSPSIAVWTVVFLLAYPFALFLGTAYAESLALLSTVGAWLAIRRGHWWIAGLAVGIALLAKIVFIVLLVPLGLELLRWEGGTALRLDRTALRRLVALWLPAIAALGTWMLFLAIQFHEPFRFIAAQHGWGRSAGLPVNEVLDIVRPGVRAGIRLANAIDTVALLGLIAMAFYVYRRVRPTYAVLLGIVAAIFFFNTSLQSNARHVDILFPVFLGLAVMTEGRRGLRVALLAVQLPIAVVMVARFATGQWAG